MLSPRSFFYLRGEVIFFCGEMFPLCPVRLPLSKAPRFDARCSPCGRTGAMHSARGSPLVSRKAFLPIYHIPETINLVQFPYARIQPMFWFHEQEINSSFRVVLNFCLRAHLQYASVKSFPTRWACCPLHLTKCYSNFCVSLRESLLKLYNALYNDFYNPHKTFW